MASFSDPSQGLIRLVEITGLVTYPERKGILFTICSLFMGTNVFMVALSMWMFAFEDHPFFDKTFAYEAVVSTFFMICKLLNVRLRARTFIGIILDTNAIWKEMLEDPKNHEIMKSESIRIKKILFWLMFLYTFPTFLTICTNTLHNLTCPPEEAQLMYRIWDPIKDTLGAEWFTLRNTYQCITVCVGLGMFGVLCCAIMYCCLMACAQMKVLIRMLEDKDLDVNASVRLHQKNIKLVHKINDLFSGVMVIELLCNALVISLRVYTFISLLKKGDPRFVEEMMFLVIVFTDPFVLCYSGQIITDLSEAVHQSSYQNSWYNLSAKDKKSLSLLMCRASLPLQLHFRHLMSFNMVRYSAVFQGSYSYITLLIKM